MRRRVASAAGAIAFAVPIAAAFMWHGVGAPIRLASVAIAIVTAWQPLWGVLIAAGLLPLDTYVAAVGGLPFGGEIVGELLICSILCGAFVRQSVHPSSAPSRLAPPALA